MLLIKRGGSELTKGKWGKRGVHETRGKGEAQLSRKGGGGGVRRCKKRKGPDTEMHRKSGMVEPRASQAGERGPVVQITEAEDNLRIQKAIADRHRPKALRERE